MYERSEFLAVNVKFLKLLGMYPLETNVSKGKKIWHYFSILLMFTFAYIMLISVTLSIFFNKQEVVKFTLNLLNVGIYVSSLLTMHIMQYYSKTIKSIIDEINKIFKKESNEGVSKVSMEYINKSVTSVSIKWYVAITICAQIMAFYPLYENTEHKKFLAVPAWFPFNWKESHSVYEILFILQCVGQFNLTNIYGVSDTLIMCVLLTTGKQIELLGCNFENCLYTTLLQVGVSKPLMLKFSSTFNQYGKNYKYTTKISKASANYLNLLIVESRFQNLLQNNLNQCVRHHQKIIKFVRKLETFIWPLLTVKIVSSMYYHILICFIIVCNANRTFFYTLGQYEIMAIYELLLFSYFGQYLVNKGEKLQLLLYNCPWYINGANFQKSFLIALKGCQCYPYLSIAKLIPLSLTTFLAIMKTSTSYFTVLRQTIEN